MDSISVFVWIVVAIIVLYLAFQVAFRMGFWDRVFGIEYFEEMYTFKKPMSADSIKELFKSIELKKQHPKNVLFYINSRHFYSIGDKEMDEWSSWIDIGEMPDKSFDDYDLKWRDAWSIVIHGPNLHCAVYNKDTHLLYTDVEFKEIRLVGLGITKFPWNKQTIRREREFLQSLVKALKDLEKENLE